METDLEFSRTVELPRFPGPSLVTRHNASEDPDQATAETVAVMRRAAIEDAHSPQVSGATRQALIGAANTRLARCASIYRSVASRIKFRSDDPVIKHLLGLDNELDLLIRPARLLTMSCPSEDCDGFTMLACSMLLCAGVPCEIVTIKADPEDPARFSHVYCQAILEDGQTLVMDCSQAAQHGFPLGWEAPEYFERKAWGVMRPEPKGLHGLEACDFSGSGEDCVTATHPTGSAFDWQSIIDQSFKLASQFGMKPGQYIQTREGVMANQVPGAVPGQYPSTAALNVGGIGTGTILLGALGLGFVLLVAKK